MQFQMHKIIDHRGILKLKKKKTVLCEKHKTLSAILGHIENPCQTYDFFFKFTFCTCKSSNAIKMHIIFKTNMIRALFEENTQR